MINVEEIYIVGTEGTSMERREIILGLLVFALRTIMINVEEIYIVGMEGTSMERRELISFIYRALLWPLLVCTTGPALPLRAPDDRRRDGERHLYLSPCWASALSPRAPSCTQWTRRSS